MSSDLIKCRYRYGDTCVMAAAMSQLKTVPVYDDLCRACQNHPTPMQPNRFTASIAIKQSRLEGKLPHVLALVERFLPYPGEAYKPTALVIGEGVGSELHGILSRVGFSITASCNCREHILEMDSNGPDWCEENIETILTWLERESRRRGYGWGQLRDAGARKLINLAIRRTRKKQAE